MASWASTLKWVANFCITDKTTVDEVKHRILKELESHADELRDLDEERVSAGLPPWHQEEIGRLTSLVARVRQRMDFAASLHESQPTPPCVNV